MSMRSEKYNASNSSLSPGTGSFISNILF
jgi:hypothetical protein